MNNIYIAIPYSDKDPNVRLWRYTQLVSYATDLAARGIKIIAPVLWCHPVHETAKATGIEIPYQYWIDVCDRDIRQASELHVIRMSGWDTSTGVKAEIEWATNNNIPIKYISATWEYVSKRTLHKLREGDVETVRFYTDYVLWDSSTAYIMKFGLPSDEEVRTWIQVLKSRPDADLFQEDIKQCEEYIKNNS